MSICSVYLADLPVVSAICMHSKLSIANTPWSMLQSILSTNRISNTVLCVCVCVFVPAVWGRMHKRSLLHAYHLRNHFERELVKLFTPILCTPKQLRVVSDSGPYCLDSKLNIIWKVATKHCTLCQCSTARRQLWTLNCNNAENDAQTQCTLSQKHS